MLRYYKKTKKALKESIGEEGEKKKLEVSGEVMSLIDALRNSFLKESFQEFERERKTTEEYDDGQGRKYDILDEELI